MRHQSGKKKLNMKSHHRRAVLRNQIIHFIKYGFLQTTKPRVKAVQKMTEKLVTIAKKGSGDFNSVRRIKSALPYDNTATRKLVTEIASRYVDRPGGYTRVILLGRRISDTAPIARLEWV